MPPPLEKVDLNLNVLRTLRYSQAAQQIEVYWMALVRDTPFSQYGTENFVMRAAGRA